MCADTELTVFVCHFLLTGSGETCSEELNRYLDMVRKGQVADADEALSFWTANQGLFPQLFALGQDLKGHSGAD